MLYAFIVLLIVGTFFGTKWWLHHRADHHRSLNMTFLKIKIPKKESKEDRESESDSMGANRDFKDTTAIMKQFYFP